MSGNKAPYTVVIEEVRRKKVVIWADGGSDASWKALDLLRNGVIEMDDSTAIKNAVTSVTESDDMDLKYYEQYCRGCHV